jgi:hypothetical protein
MAEIMEEVKLTPFTDIPSFIDKEAKKLEIFLSANKA